MVGGASRSVTGSFFNKVHSKTKQNNIERNVVAVVGYRFPSLCFLCIG